MKLSIEQLWEYIDGQCSNEKAQEIEKILQQDRKTRQEFSKLLSFHKGLVEVFRETSSPKANAINLDVSPRYLKAQFFDINSKTRMS